MKFEASILRVVAIVFTIISPLCFWSEGWQINRFTLGSVWLATLLWGWYLSKKELMRKSGSSGSTTIGENSMILARHAWRIQGLVAAPPNP